MPDTIPDEAAILLGVILIAGTSALFLLWIRQVLRLSLLWARLGWQRSFFEFAVLGSTAVPIGWLCFFVLRIGSSDWSMITPWVAALFPGLPLALWIRFLTRKHGRATVAALVAFPFMTAIMTFTGSVLTTALFWILAAIGGYLFPDVVILPAALISAFVITGLVFVKGWWPSLGRRHSSFSLGPMPATGDSDVVSPSAIGEFDQALGPSGAGFSRDHQREQDEERRAEELWRQQEQWRQEQEQRRQEEERRRQEEYLRGMKQTDWTDRSS